MLKTLECRGLFGKVSVEARMWEVVTAVTKLLNDDDDIITPSQNTEMIKF